MNTLHDRMEITKTAPNLHPHTKESTTMDRAVERWEQQKDKNGNLNVIYQAEMGETNGKSAIEKAVNQKKLRKTGDHFVGKV